MQGSQIISQVVFHRLCYMEYDQKNINQKIIFFQKSILFIFWKIIKKNWKVIYFFTATAALYLGLSLTDTQRSHLRKRQFSTLILLLQPRKVKVKVAYYYHHNDHHHHCSHHHCDHHQYYQNTQNYQTCKKIRKIKNLRILRNCF